MDGLAWLDGITDHFQWRHDIQHKDIQHNDTHILILSRKTISTMALCIIALRKITLSITALSIVTLSIMPLSKVNLRIMTLRKMKLSIITAL